MMEQARHDTPDMDLEAWSDQELQALMTRAAAIIKAREEARLQEAVDKIRDIAKENGLIAAVRKSARRTRKRKYRKQAEK